MRLSRLATVPAPARPPRLRRAPAATAGRFRCALLLAAALVAGLAAPARAQEPENLNPVPVEASIVYQDGRPAERVQMLQSGPVVWITGQDLSAILRAGRFWRADVRKLTFRINEREIMFTVGSEIAVLDRTEFVHLAGPVLYRDGRVFLPLAFLFDAQGNPLPWVSQSIAWDAARRELDVGGRPPGLLSVEFSGDNRLDLAVSEARDYRLLSTSRAHFALLIPGITLDRERVRVPSGSRRFLSLEVAPAPDGVEVSFAVPDSVVGYQVLAASDPHRISVVLTDDERFVRDNQVEPFAEAAPGGGIEIRTVAIDPGHGGGDPGAVSATGAKEADLALALARAVALQLQDRLGIHAVLTRDDDRDVSPEARAEIANLAKADLLLSLHYDAWPSPSVKGPRAVVARGGGDGTGEPAAKNPAAAGGSAAAGLALEPWGLSQAGQAGKARLLAETLVRAVADTSGHASRGVEEWPLPVLEGARMPAVLLEVDALTAPGVDHDLAEGDLAGRLAGAIVSAIDRYRREMP